jgi:hypothetical protein
MKKIFLLFSFVALSLGINAQKDDHSLTFDGLGALKVGMTKAELEKLLKTKIVLKEIGVTEVYTETVKATYKGIDFELFLMRFDPEVARLEAVSTTSPLFKTPEGIGIGTDQTTIINAYEKHLLIITKEEITYADISDIRSSIVFTMQNKKVVKIAVAPTAAFRDRE